MYSGEFNGNRVQRKSKQNIVFIQFTEVYNTECSYMELKKLKVKLDAFEMSLAAEQSVGAYLDSNDLDPSNRYPEVDKWAFNVLACSFTDKEYEQVSTTLSTLHRNCCGLTP